MTYSDQLGAAIKAENVPVPVYGKAAEAAKKELPGDNSLVSYAEARAVLLSNQALRREVMEKYPDYALRVATLGDTVWFGSYDYGGSVESIEWIVLRRDGKKLLLLSKQGLDAAPMHPVYENVAWSGCTLRNWLNGEFVKTAFTSQEQSMILYTPLSPDREVNIYANHGENTMDRLFLLTLSDVREYFPKEQDRLCEPTAYAVSRGAYCREGKCWWWLRTPGCAPLYYTFCYLNERGELKDRGDGVDHPDNAVRPAMWISLG